MQFLLALILSISLDDIILDIYRAVTEFGEVDYEQLQSDLYALHDSPIDLNHTTEEELSLLPFLSTQQIDDILSYADRHPFESAYELRMISSLTDYEIRDLIPFVHVRERAPDNKMYAREVLHYGSHEVLSRIDARDIEGYTGSDPMYIQARYKFDYQRRVTAGFQLRRPAGSGAEGLQYNGYLQLRDIGHLHTLTAGHFQASFGQGLVFAPVFHTGKSAYAGNVGMSREGLRYYSSPDGEGLQGAGATFRWQWGKQMRLDASALYSIKRANDSTLHHLIGANITFRYKRLQVEVSGAENIWSDSIGPYRHTAYNEHYFRGRDQAVVGASARYNHGWFDAFGEVATSQNTGRWGVGGIVGSRFYPVSGISLTALYRYYSPWFDNMLGYAFSETSRLGDENGGYIGFDITRLSRWRFSGYGDVFRFSGPKYGINQFPTIGYDVMAEAQYHAAKEWWAGVRLRVREKGNERLLSGRAMFEWSRGGWSLRSTAEANGWSNYGVTFYQDVAYRFHTVPIGIRGRVQFFDAREWANRIYCYEHDVLYAYGNSAVYGLGGKAYLCFHWQIIRQLGLYLKFSETVFESSWAATHSRRPTRTDIHLLLRARL